VVANAKVSSDPAGASTVEFVADCPASVVVDDLVYVTGPAISGVIQVDIVDVTLVAKMPAIGIVIEKITSTSCRVLTQGEVTPTLTLVPGKRYFAGASGSLAVAMPTPATSGIAFSQPVGYAIDTNRLLFDPEKIPIIRID